MKFIQNIDPRRYDDFVRNHPVKSHFMQSAAWGELCEREKGLRAHLVGMENERGELVLVSRQDAQIKHMGHRVELGEIEAAAAALPEIRLCACLYDGAKAKIILCYVGEIAQGELAQRLRARLPRYMLPARLIPLDAMPFTANGKIDRLALKQRYIPQD